MRILLATTLIILSGCNLPSLAQLPQTNMGQFVHQPGDNQYTNQTQGERHASVSRPVSAPSSSAPMSQASTGSEYRPTPAAPKPDVSLLPVVADEPVKPAGFPPLPDRLDLPTVGTGVWTTQGGQQAGGRSGIAGGGMAPGGYISSSPSGVHQHYVHYQPGAFIPKDEQQKSGYRPSATDYYNVNPAAKAGGNASNVEASGETPSVQALKHMAPEPRLAADAVSKPEVPTAVTVNQSVSQDLSLPEDDFNKHYPTAINNSGTNRASRRIGQTLMYPARYLLYSGAGMAMGAGMYAVRR